MNFAEWMMHFICVCLASLVFHATYANSGKHSEESMSIDKLILDAAPDAQMFDVFHIMPEGDIKVMTELDLLLTLDQYKEMHGTVNLFDDEVEERPTGKRSLSKRRRGQRRRRKADNDGNLKWPECKVYYEVDDSFSAEDKENLNEAITEWQRYTCLVFTESNAETSRIQFKNGGGCYSQLGRQATPQPIALAPKCRTKGIIAHEIGHAIGWYHEHMRPDRDDYIAVNFDKIPARYKVNYQKYTREKVNTYGVEYDYESLMHYGADAVRGSITALDPDYQEKMGQRVGLSYYDIKMANIMYECAKVMICRPLVSCPHGGFQLYKRHKGSDRCLCWCNSGDLSDPLILCSEITSPPPRPLPRPTETPTIGLCYDIRRDCQAMKDKGYCMLKMDLMMDACMETCGFCNSGEEGEDKAPPDICMDHDKGCGLMATTGLCQSLGPIMAKQCPASCEMCPSPPDPCKIQEMVMGSKFSDIAQSEDAAPRLANVSFLAFALGCFLSIVNIFSGLVEHI